MNRQKRHNRVNWSHISAFVISFFLLVFLFYGSNLPYVGYNAWNFNTYALIAHNYTLFGFLATKFAPIVSISSLLPSNPEYYLNHPQLLSVLIAIVFRFFGESFFTGRLVNIFATFFSCFLLYRIAYELAGKKYATVVFATSALVPAVTVFGKMIEQESLVLFFSLFSSWASLRYVKTKKKSWLFLGVTGIILGTLSDWAMVYFTISFSMYLLYRKMNKIALMYFLASFFTAVFYIVYTYWITGDLRFLYNGFLNRSLGELLRMQGWVISWMSTLAFRLLFYFNPLIVFFALFYFFKSKKNENKNLFVFILCFFVFGIAHIALYPEGSFGHPYWMYYLVPSVVFSSGFVILRFIEKRSTVLIGFAIAVSFFYVLSLNIWKTNEIKGNVFRYDLAKHATVYFVPYKETAFLNRDGLIDPEIIQYSFHLPTGYINKEVPSLKSGGKIVYTCFESCDLKDKQFSELRQTFSHIQFIGNRVEMWMFFQNNAASKPRLIKKEYIHVSVPDNRISWFKKIYGIILAGIHAPQL